MQLVADNLTVTNAVVRKAIDDLDPAPIQELVKRCLAAGAEAIDINPGPLKREPERRMTFLVETVQAITDKPLLLDTTNPAALEAGLVACRNTAIINGFFLDPFRLEHILPLAARFNTDIVGFLLRPDSHVPPDEAERLEIAVALYAEFHQAGLPDERLIIDPVIAPLIWENGNVQDMAVLSTIRNLPDLLGFPVRTIAGLSNLTIGDASRPKKIRMETAYLPMLAAAGLEMALLNVFRAETVRTARACNALTDPKIFAWESVPGVSGES
jgi:5-methyltetrahydrofolate corrinoid/iron sulfur protein methyltransferase